MCVGRESILDLVYLYRTQLFALLNHCVHCPFQVCFKLALLVPRTLFNHTHTVLSVLIYISPSKRVNITNQRIKLFTYYFRSQYTPFYE